MKKSRKPTGLEALDNLRDYGEWLPALEMGIIRRELKALEIIKDKQVDVCYFMNCRTLEEYNDDVLGSYAYDENDANQRMLTKEQFDLLKEVLL